MNPIRIMSVVGARPNFMKIAPFCRAIEEHNTANSDPAVDHCLIHTGQHYDTTMSTRFFDALGIPSPDRDLGIGSGSHAEQVGNTMIAFEQVVREWVPDWIVVVGDVNATCACSITAKKEHVMLAHIEAGLRSGDLDMPEEINRMVTDRLSDLLLTTDELADQNLANEGVSPERIRRVGNIMIDSLEAHREQANQLDVQTIINQHLIVPKRTCDDPVDGFSLLTLHRPSNVDARESLEPLVSFLVDEAAPDQMILWPIHPRTEQRLKDFGLWERVSECPRLFLLRPVGYLEMLKLNMEAALMFTDSGGLQEECCLLGTPCLTLRWNTERPKTLSEHGGVSVLVGNDVDRIREAYAVARNQPTVPFRPDLWDGKTAARCLSAILDTTERENIRSSVRNEGSGRG